MQKSFFKILSLALLSNLYFSCGESSKTAAHSNSTAIEKSISSNSDINEQGASGKKVNIESFTLSEWPPKVNADDGCSCTFRSDKDNYTAEVFASDMQSSGCIKLDGKIQSLSGGRVDERMNYYEQVNDKYWVTLNEKGDQFIFKNAIHFEMENWYDEARQELINTLLVMDEMPKEIPMKINGQLGMGIRGEFRSMLEEAIQIARAERKKGNTGIPIEMVFKNANYNCNIKAKVVGKTDSGGDKYQGEMIIKSASGKILGKKKVWGQCGC